MKNLLRSFLNTDLRETKVTRQGFIKRRLKNMAYRQSIEEHSDPARLKAYNLKKPIFIYFLGEWEIDD